MEGVEDKEEDGSKPDGCMKPSGVRVTGITLERQAEMWKHG